MTKFIIRRTSKWWDECPYEEAKLEELDCWDIRTASKEIMQADHPYDNYDDYENFTAYNGETWCRKSVKEKHYTIEVADVYEFCEKLDERVIVFPKSYDDDLPYPVIEIYDNWRE